MKNKKRKWKDTATDILGIGIIVYLMFVLLASSCSRTEASSVEVTTNKYAEMPLSEALRNHVFGLCADYEIEPEIIFAIIEKESGYNARAIGDNGKSAGLMQIQERYHYDRIERLGVTDLFDPFENVQVGIDYLAALVKENGGNLEMALIAYNAGQSGAETNYFSKGIYSNAYSQRVLEIAQILREGMNEMYTDDPIADFHRHDAEQAEALAKLPVCSECDNPIQTEEYYEFNDELICPECLQDNHRKWVEDYIE